MGAQTPIGSECNRSTLVRLLHQKSLHKRFTSFDKHAAPLPGLRSDGIQPHIVNVEFQRKVALSVGASCPRASAGESCAQVHEPMNLEQHAQHTHTMLAGGAHLSGLQV